MLEINGGGMVHGGQVGHLFIVGYMNWHDLQCSCTVKLHELVLLYFFHY